MVKGMAMAIMLICSGGEFKNGEKNKLMTAKKERNELIY